VPDPANVDDDAVVRVSEVDVHDVTPRLALNTEVCGGCGGEGTGVGE
jgi:hypothetical protein